MTAYEQNAAFLTWLHTEAGYRFTGDDGLYALTYPEIRILFDGYQVMQEQAELQAKGVSAEDQAAFKDFASDLNSGGPGPAGTAG